MNRIVAAGILLLGLCAAGQAQTSVGSNVVPGHGVLKIVKPANWTEQVQRAREEGMPPTIKLTDAKGMTTVLITPLWSPQNNPKFNSPEAIQEAIQRAATSIAPTAVEKELLLQPIESRGGKGYFFSATDRAPKAGEYEYMSNGAVPAGSLLLSFTVLSHVKPPAGIAEARTIIESAEQSAKPD